MDQNSVQNKKQKYQLFQKKFFKKNEILHQKSELKMIEFFECFKCFKLKNGGMIPNKSFQYYYFVSMRACLPKKTQFGEDKNIAQYSQSSLCQIVNLIKSDKFIKKMFKDEEKSVGSGILSCEYKVKPKMFVKLSNWMERVCFETFNFNSETFEISVKILLKFLQAQDPHPRILQMLGCISLHLASKLNQPKIVAIQTYIDCCLGIFTKEQFTDLQEKVYNSMRNCLNSDLTLHQLTFYIYSQILKINVSIHTELKINLILTEIVKNLENWSFDQIQLCSQLAVKAQINDLDSFNTQDFISDIQSKKIRQ